MIIITALDENFRGRKLVSSPDLYFLVDISGRLLNFHGNEDLLYLPPKEFLGKTINEVLPEKIAQLYEIAIKETYETKEPTIFDYSLPLDDGLHYYEAIIFYISENRVAIYVRDTTKQRKTEQNLKESEEKFRKITEESLLAISIIQDNIIKYVNQEIATLYGYTLEEMYNWKPGELLKTVAPESLETVKEQLRKKQIGDPDVIVHYPIQIIKKNGDLIWVDNISKTILYEGRPADLVTQIDITEIINAERRLKDSERKVKNERDNLINILNSMEDGVYIVNEQYEIEFVNSSLRNEFGPIGNKKCYEYFQDLPEPCQWCKNQEKIEQGSIRWELESPITKKFYEVIATPIKRSDNSVSKLVIFHDITDRKKAEQKLIESEDKFRIIAEQAVVGISIIQDNEIKYANQRSLDYFGYTKEEVEKWPPGYLINVIHPDFREMILEITRKNQSDDAEEPSHVEIKTIRKSGEIQWTEIYLRSIIFNGKRAIMTMNVDITERKKAVNKIKRAREKADMYLNLVNVIIVALDKDGNISLINKKGNNILGWNEGELINKNWFENGLPPHERERVFDYFKKLMNGEIDVVPFYENPVLTKDGKERLIAWSTIILKDSNGYIAGLLSSGEDITDRKKAQQKLIESEEKYRSLIGGLSQTGIGIDIIDSNYNIIYQNQLLREQFGEPKNRKCFNLYLRRDDKCENCPMIRAIKNKRVEKEIIIASNNHTYEILSAPLPDPSGTIDRVAEVVIDISEKLEAEKKLKELSKLKSELLTRTSHELKTPAMHIKGYADLLLHKYKDNLGIDELQIISHIKKGVLRLETLIYDIMHKAELDTCEGELNKIRSDLSSIIELSVKELRSFAALRGHSIKLNIDDNMIINFDEEQIHHVLNNLITNAIKYTPLNGIIGINSTITDDFITIAIQDNGIGLTERQINQLFTQFGKIERYGQGFDIITEGSGLGLYIAKKIIDLHRGKIWVESEGINKGSTFYFSLPKVNN
ncbi:MAG: PAS domain S-box protein [Promethearchaeota archaeon]